MNRSCVSVAAALFGLAAFALPAGASMPAAGVAGALPPAANPLLIRVAVQPYSLTYSPRNVQLLLNELGYNVGTADGVIGGKSRSAIMAFEGNAGMAVTGQPSLPLFYRLQAAVAHQQGGTAAAPAAAQTT
jgi:peptidoglycan hydrolase-like protein with peptidoglycan-binding domain